MNRIGMVLLALVSSAVLGDPALARTDTTFTYQCVLKDGGAPVSGTVDITVRVFNSASGGLVPLGTNSFPSTSVTDGLVALNLDFGASVFNGSDRWLEIEVDGNILLPRQPIHATPYAMYAMNVSSSAVPFVYNGPNAVFTGGNVGIGTTSPQARVHIEGGSSDSLALWGDSIGGVPSVHFRNATTANDWFLRHDDSKFHIVGDGALDVMTWQNNGRVGIGTDTPAQKLHIEGEAGDALALYGASNNSVPDIHFRNTTEARDWILRHDDTKFHLMTQTTPGSEVMTLEVNGRVGIGTTSPSWPLDVAGAQAVGKFTSTSSPFGSVIELRNSTPGASHLGAFNFVNDLGQFQGQIAYTADDLMTFRVNGVERSRIDADGRLGVGTISPSAKVDVLAQGETAISGLCDFGTTAIDGWVTTPTGTTYGVHGRSDSTSGVGVYGETTSSTGLSRGVVGESESNQGMGVYAAAYSAAGATYGCYAESSSSSGTGAFGFATSGSGVNVGVGGRSNSASGFDFYASGAGLDYGTSSSRRWKHNIERIDEPLYLLSKLRGVYYDWDEEHGGHHDIGMIAEEVGAVLPEIVQYEENGVDAIGMDYSKLTPLLVEAVNALRVEKDTQMAVLRDENDALQLENELIRARLESLELLIAELSTRN